MTTPPPRPETIENLGMAAFPSFAMLAGMELDLFTPLGNGALTADEIAEALGVAPGKLRPLLYALVAARLLTVDGDRFGNIPEADHFLVRGKPSYIGDRRLYFRDRWNDALHVAASIRTGEAQTKLEFSRMSPDELESFLRGLHPGTLLSGRNLLTRFDFSGYRSLLDVGGGSGVLAITITEAYPQMRAVVVDLPTVTPIAQKMVMEAGAQDRVSVTTADVVREPLSGHYDVAVLSSFIQVLSPEEASRVLRNVSEVLEPGGTIYILGRVLDNSRLSPEETMYFNLVFISIYDGGQAYTEDEYREWLTEAGFEDSERVVNPNGTSIIRARKGA